MRYYKAEIRRQLDASPIRSQAYRVKSRKKRELASFASPARGERRWRRRLCEGAGDLGHDEVALRE